MVENYWFDVCAVLLMCVILYMHAAKKNLMLRQNRLFLSELLLVLCTAISGLSGIIAEEMIKAGKDTCFCSYYFLCTMSYIYFVTHILTAVVYVFYVYALLNISSFTKNDYFKLFAPVMAAFVFLAATPFTGAVFYYDSALNYHRGSMILIFYAVAVYYVIYGFATVIRYSANISIGKRTAIIAFMFMAFTGNMIQCIWPALRVENFFNALVLLMIYIEIEKPSDMTDFETGLPNADAFYSTADVRRQRNTGMNFVLVTIDNIISMEDKLGQETVGLLMKEVTRYLKHFSKQADIYLLDPGVFAVALKTGSANLADSIIKMISERFMEPFILDRMDIMLFECCCYISYPTDAFDVRSLKRLIELACDSKRHRNRHIIRVYELDMAGENKRREINRLLKTAVQDKSIVIRYQPILCVRSGRFETVETQMVMKTNEYGLLTAKEFVPVAEKNGCISEISRYLFNEVCRFISIENLSEYGIRACEITLPVIELMKYGIVDEIMNVVSEYGIDTGMIEFEITEDAVMTYQGQLKENMQRLREEGFRFVLDNYGNGYTNTGMIIEIPLSLVTLDRRLTQAAVSSKKADTLLRCTTEMIRRLNLKIKAERIETQKQEEYALELGCDYLQGYHLAMPYDGSELLQFLKGGNAGSEL